MIQLEPVVVHISGKNEWERGREKRKEERGEINNFQ